MAAFLNAEFPDDIAGVMTSWPGRVLSVRLARILHDSDFTNWITILEDPERFLELHGVGRGVKAEVSDLFSGIRLRFGIDQSFG